MSQKICNNKKCRIRISVVVISSSVPSYLFTEISIQREGVGKQRKSTLMGLWSKGGSWPLHKKLFIYHCDTIRHGHPSEKMAGRLPFSALSSLACSFSPLAFSGRIMRWVCLSPSLFSFWVWECLISWWTWGKKDKKTEREQTEYEQRSHRERREKSDRHRTVHIRSHTHGYSLTNIMKHTGKSHGVHIQPKNLHWYLWLLVCPQNSHLSLTIPWILRHRITWVINKYITSISGRLIENCT